MRFVQVGAPIAVALALTATQARAEDTQKSDLKCVLAMSALVQNPQFKDAAAAGLFYYLGRVEGRDPTIELGPALKRTAGDMQLSAYAGEARRCGAALREKNEILKAAGETLRSRGVGR